MNKKNQGIEVKLPVIAISAILVASLFVMGSSRFIPDAMAQNVTNMTGGAANMTGGAAGGAANMTGGAAGGGLANQTGGLMIPQGTLMEIVSNLNVLEGAVGDDEESMTALDAILGALEERAMQAGITLPEPAAEEDTGDEGDDTAADEGDDTAADEGDDTAADEGDDTAADEGDDTTETTE
ncbi:MAG TPA: hypothetical protein VFY64_03305 [Nitrososphaeraceae archaeon]|nr:hypothetical protein [Nitrososphaeraceae archaeon]